jgi:hypothetical protein
MLRGYPPPEWNDLARLVHDETVYRVGPRGRLSPAGTVHTGGDTPPPGLRPGEVTNPINQDIYSGIDCLHSGAKSM